MQGVQARGMWAVTMPPLLKLRRTDGRQGNVVQSWVCRTMYGVLAVAIRECTTTFSASGALGATVLTSQDYGNGAVHRP